MVSDSIVKSRRWQRKCHRRTHKQYRTLLSIPSSLEIHKAVDTTVSASSGDENSITNSPLIVCKTMSHPPLFKLTFPRQSLWVANTTRQLTAMTKDDASTKSSRNDRWYFELNIRVSEWDVIMIPSTKYVTCGSFCLNKDMFCLTWC